VIAAGDLVFVNRRGRLFYAHVTGAQRARRLTIAPLERAVRDRSAAIEDLVEQWSRTRTPLGVRPAPGQLQLEGWGH
jgi:hypothetical protein